MSTTLTVRLDDRRRRADSATSALARGKGCVALEEVIEREPVGGRRRPISADVELELDAAYIQLDVRRKSAADVVVYDRFAFDHLFKGDAALAIPPRLRQLVALSARLLRMSSRTVNVVLTVDADTIRARKAEMAPEQIDAYFRCARDYFGRDATWISAAPPPAEVSSAAVSAFLAASLTAGCAGTGA